MELLTNLAFGFDVALTASNLLYCFIGVTLGTLVGVLPGIGPLATISMLLPITFGLDPVGSLIMLAGIYYGAQFGSSVTAVLLNLPSHAAAAVVCLDGYPMAKQGRAAEALVMSALASFVGGSLAIVLVMTLAPPLATFALRFGPAEYTSMMVLALIAASVLTQGSLLKGLGMVLLGLGIGLVGIDVNSGISRFTFGSWHLYDGISFVIIAMGFFAISEVMTNLETKAPAEITKKSFTWRELIPSLSVFRQAFPSMLRGFGVGAVFGPLPGSGPTLSSFIAYTVEKRVARQPQRFGKGAIEGVTSPESANNTAAITGFIPTLTLGVPGDAIMALLLGALMIHGITPGPRVITANPELFWGLVASMWIGNVLLLLLNIPLIGAWVRVLMIPYRILAPSILLFICIGVFSIGNDPFDVILLAVSGLAGYVLVKLGCPAAPLLLGVILGPLIEENLRRALLISLGDPTVFVTRPISLALLLAAAGLVIGSLVASYRQHRAGRAAATGA
jgi:putative tricarboxylic transport membrane protein